MSTFRETLFSGRDNFVRLKLFSGSDAFATAYPGVTPSRWTLVAGDFELDSDESGMEGVFAWDGTGSVLTISLAGLSATAADFEAATLTCYTDEWSNGVVWLHPTATDDKLYLRIV